MSDSVSDLSRDVRRHDLAHYFYIAAHIWLGLLVEHLPQLAEWLRRARYFDTSDRGSVNPTDLICFAYCAAAQLGLPLNFPTVRKLLLDRDFFFSHLPLPPDDPRWKFGRPYGVGVILSFWWESRETEPFRQQIAEYLNPIPDNIDEALFLFWPDLPQTFLDEYRELHARFFQNLRSKLKLT